MRCKQSYEFFVWNLDHPNENNIYIPLHPICGFQVFSKKLPLNYWSLSAYFHLKTNVHLLCANLLSIRTSEIGRKAYIHFFSSHFALPCRFSQVKKRSVNIFFFEFSAISLTLSYFVSIGHILSHLDLFCLIKSYYPFKMCYLWKVF